MPSSVPGNVAILSELVELACRDADRRLGALRSQAGAHQYLRLYRLFCAYVPARAEVLDWGAGNGHFSYFLTRTGYRATGFGFEEPCFIDERVATSYSFVMGSPSDPIALPFADKSFDAVASIGVLEHVRETGGNEAASLGEIRRVLRPGGTFVCYHLPNRLSAIDFVARQLPGVHHHRYRFDRREIERLVATTGLELLETRRYGIVPRNPWSAFPRPLRFSVAVAKGWDVLDEVAGRLLSPLCQNYWFVARKRSRPPNVAGSPRPSSC